MDSWFAAWESQLLAPHFRPTALDSLLAVSNSCPAVLDFQVFLLHVHVFSKQAQTVDQLAREIE
jgi:hypothetical protein